MLPVRVVVDTCLTDPGPVGGERIVSGVPPVVEDLVGDLGDEACPGLGGSGVVGGGGFGLGEGDAGVVVEDVDEEEDARDDGPDEEGDGDEAQAVEQGFHTNAHLESIAGGAQGGRRGCLRSR